MLYGSIAKQVNALWQSMIPRKIEDEFFFLCLLEISCIRKELFEEKEYNEGGKGVLQTS